MKLEIHVLSEAEILESYSIKGKTKGWYFRAIETSNNAWLVEGSDVWGRKVTIQGSDPETLLKDAEKEASNINIETKST